MCKKTIMKFCLSCNTKKEAAEFLNEKGREVKSCKTCRDYQKNYYAKNKESHSECMKRHRGNAKDYAAKYIKENKDTLREKIRAWNALNAKFDTFAHKLTILEDAKRGDSGELLVKCSKCQKYFSPKNSLVQNRVQALNGERSGESRLYCSDECKSSCEVFNIKFDPYAKHVSVERDPAWSKDVKERAKYLCERCGSKEKLEAHHEIAVKVDSTKANDLDNGICLCHECHMKAHSESGCTLSDLRKHNATNPQS